ncbi:MAG TPA: hypothetical protein VEB64_17020 [Azospirillaceae bacterium]|nr:hypothetical protein [Azospirillaceae bacterium]
MTTLQLFPECPNDSRCGPWRTGIDVRLCVRCGREFADEAQMAPEGDGADPEEEWDEDWGKQT